jgi:hypothetical protein
VFERDHPEHLLLILAKPYCSPSDAPAMPADGMVHGIDDWICETAAEVLVGSGSEEGKRVSIDELFVVAE